ncbi:MAG: hypothetical protein ABSF50_19630 [Burkholderiaceae bacterium]|jgi:hypothetical protein
MTTFRAFLNKITKFGSTDEPESADFLPASKMGVTLSSTGQSSVDIADIMKTKKFRDDLEAIKEIEVDIPVYLRRK